MVNALVERHRQMLHENAQLRALVEERDQRLRRLDGEALELNQRHKDVAKRIDDLIAQVVLLESQLGPVSG